MVGSAILVATKTAVVLSGKATMEDLAYTKLVAESIESQDSVHETLIGQGGMEAIIVTEDRMMPGFSEAIIVIGHP